MPLVNTLPRFQSICLLFLLNQLLNPKVVLVFHMLDELLMTALSVRNDLIS